MRFFSKLCSIAIVFISSAVYADTIGSFTENGITGTVSVRNVIGSNMASFGQTLYKEAIRFNSHDISNTVGTGTYIYNSANGTSATAGSVDVSGLNGRFEQIKLISIAGGTVTVSIEYGIGSTTVWESTEIEMGATGTVNMVTITEDVDRVRIGIKKSNLGTATVLSESSYQKVLK